MPFTTFHPCHLNQSHTSPHCEEPDTDEAIWRDMVPVLEEEEALKTPEEPRVSRLSLNSDVHHQVSHVDTHASGHKRVLVIDGDVPEHGEAPMVTPATTMETRSSRKSTRHRTDKMSRHLSQSSMHYLRHGRVVSNSQLLQAYLGRCRGTTRKRDSTDCVGKQRSNEDLHGSDGPAMTAVDSERETSFSKPLDWVMAMVLPHPSVLPSYVGISEAVASNIYAACIKPEEWLSGDFSRRDATAEAELAVFLQAFQMLPDSGDKHGKAYGEATQHHRMSFHGWSHSDNQSAAEPEDDEVPRSFQELLQNVIITKLVLHCGLYVEAIRSDCGQQTVLLITCKPLDLMREADRQCLPAELDVVAVDPEALEPCTETMFPLATWYFGRKRNEVTPEMRTAMHTAIEAMRAVIEKAPRRECAAHAKILNFWRSFDNNRTRGTTSSNPRTGFWLPIPSHLSLRQTFSKSSTAFTSHMSHEANDIELPEEVKDLFMEYLALKAEAPMSKATDLIRKVNESRPRSKYKLQSWYDTLGVEEIPPFHRFEAGMYLGHGARPWMWRHHGARMQGSRTQVCTPFRAHQIISLVRSMIERQLDFELLNECRVVTATFPLDTQDKLETSSDWGWMHDGEGGYFRNLRMGVSQRERPTEERRTQSEIAMAWALPTRALTCWAWMRDFLKSFAKPPSVDAIRNYYGEQIALYFGVTLHLCLWYIVPAVLGVLTALARMIFTDENHPVPHLFTILYCFGCTCWNSASLEAWKRREAVLAAMWGQSRQSGQRNLLRRPGFHGMIRRSPIDFSTNDEFEVQCCAHGRIGQLPRQIVSYTILGALVILQLGVLCLILELVRRYTEKELPFHNRADAVAGLVIGCTMLFQSYIIRIVCRKLNRWENYRTSPQYLHHLIIKQCSCEFVNQFGFYFYVGFAKGAVQGCRFYEADGLRQASSAPVKQISDITLIGDAMCVDELSTYMRLMFAFVVCSNIIESTGTEWIMPLLRKKCLCRKSSDAEDDHREEEHAEADDEEKHQLDANKPRNMASIIQSMLHREEYGSVDEGGTFADYLELVILYGHTALFSVVFPLAPLIVLLLLIVEVRVDGHKLFYTVRRPLPEKAENIGAWMYVFQFISWASVMTNSFLAIFGLRTMEGFGYVSPSSKWVAALGAILVLVCFKGIIMVGVPDVPESLRTLESHYEWLMDQLYDKDLSIKPDVIGLDDLSTVVKTDDSVEARRDPKDFGLGARTFTFHSL